MKLSAYIVRFDTGFAPNPFGHWCTLACCKPTIRKNAEPEDIVVGTASASSSKPGHLIYAMRVKYVLPLQCYWRAPRFRSRKPHQRSEIGRRGDNIWRQESGEWKVAARAFHDNTQRDRDVGGGNVLVATEFFYFGREAIPVKDRFADILATTQGHKNCREADRIEAFWQWVKSRARKPGRIGLPSDFSDDACRGQRNEQEGDDFEES